jgi:hypothetical protein
MVQPDSLNVGCKIALQYIAEIQSVGLAALLELLLVRLDDAIGQSEAQLRQCPCTDAAPRGVLTWLPGSRRTSPVAVSVDAEDLYAEEEGLAG